VVWLKNVYSFQFYYPPQQEPPWDFVSYFQPDSRFQEFPEATGSYFGSLKLDKAYTPNYLASSLSNAWVSPDSLRMDVYGTAAGPGGYDRTGFKFKIPDPFEISNAPPFSAISTLKVFINLTHRSMEHPETTDYEFTTTANFIVAPQTITCPTYTVLKPNQQRSLMVCNVIHGEYEQGSVPTRDNYILCDLSWKDKTGVKPLAAYGSLRFEAHYVVNSSTVSPITSVTNPADRPLDLRTGLLGPMSPTSQSTESLCLLDNSEWDFIGEGEAPP